MDLDSAFKRIFDDDEPDALGSGWWSGVASVFLGMLGFAGGLCLLFPEWLTTPSVRQAVSLPLAHGLVQGCIALSLLSGFVSALLRRRKVLALAGVTLALLGSLAGSGAPPPAVLGGRGVLGLDWFALNLLLTTLVFVPMERAFPLKPSQSPFRVGWTTDAAHFLVSHLLVQLSLYMTLAPARVLFAWALSPALHAFFAGQPLVVQFLEVMVVADLTEYSVHRLFHQIPLLWRFHAIHHSARAMDWLAGSRLHLVDIFLTRGLTFVPIFVLGFAAPAVYAYLIFVSFHAVFIHANVRFNFGTIEGWIATPRFHHWHHSAATEAIDRNFAVHLPLIDRVFGTHYAPKGQWPDAYGIQGDPVPDGYWDQTTWPWVKTR